MKKYDYLDDSKNIKIKKIPEDIDIPNETSKDIDEVYKRYKNYSSNELIKYVYSHFPYFTIKSKIRNGFISKESLKKFLNNDEKIIYSIGYEGKDIDKFLNQLVKNNITLLCDVRKNPVSMKYGFSKNKLKNYCSNLEIDYIHLPEFGIDSVKRQNLNSFEEYNNLFYFYLSTVLPTKIKEIENLLNIIKSHRKIAFSCFEANHNYCHRSHLLDYIYNKYVLDYKILHI
ncbi:MAG: DUF488 family protein [Ignavibacteria bacterium]|nr:DUF488 family protein [Ignavibacteria bacterium]